MVASQSGVYLASVCFVRPGSGGRKFFSIAVCSVEIAGENRAAWWNATMSAGVHELPIAGLAEAVKRSVIWWSSWIWSAHRPCGVCTMQKRGVLSKGAILENYEL